MSDVQGQDIAAPEHGLDQPARPLPWPIVVGLLCGPFVAMVDTNVVNVAILSIAGQLHATLAVTAWTISVYLLGIATGLPASAWLARSFGADRVYGATLLAFGLASAGCALAPNVISLIALRALQGLSAAPLVPLSLTMLFTNAAGHRFPAVGGVLMFLAPAVGPTLGGAMVTIGGWRSVFLVNLPLIAIGYLCARRLPRSAARPRRQPADLPGLALLAIGSTLTSLGSTQLFTHTISNATGWVAVAVAVAALVAYGWHERRTEHPALSLRLLSLGPDAWVALAVSALASIVLFAVLFLAPVLVQEIQQRSALASGLVLLPQGVAMGAATILGGKLMRTGRYRATITCGMAVLGLTTASMLALGASSPLWLVAALVSWRGLALGLTLQPLIAGLLAGVRAGDMADASTVFTVSQRIGGSVGITAVAAFYQARAATSANPFRDTVWLLIVITAAGLIAATALPARSGQ